MGSSSFVNWIEHITVTTYSEEVFLYEIFAFIFVFVYMCFLKHLENKFLTMSHYLKNKCIRNIRVKFVCF